MFQDEQPLYISIHCALQSLCFFQSNQTKVYFAFFIRLYFIINMALNQICITIVLILGFFFPHSISVCISDLTHTSNQAINGDFQLVSLGTSSYRQSVPGNIAGWVSTKSEIGRGTLYNSRWGATQVIELATINENTMYNNTVVLVPGVKYKISVQCAARQHASLSTSGVRVLWNDVVKVDDSTPKDYLIHSYTFKVIPTSTTNKLTLQARGTVDGQGSSCDNIQVRRILAQYRRIQINNTCVCQPGFYQTPPSQQCLPCLNFNPLCELCSNSSNGSSYEFKCEKCFWGYFVDNNYQCSTCNLSLSFCQNCSMDGAQCYSCENIANIILVNGSCICPKGFYLQNNLCNPCSNQDSNCIDCILSNSSQFICKQCMSNYFSNSTNCIQCRIYHEDCISCSSLGCQLCDQSQIRQIFNGTCICSDYYFQNQTSNLCQLCTNIDDNCLKCQVKNHTFNCILCIQGYYSDNGFCSFCNNSLPGCMDCSMDGNNCTHCDNQSNYFLLFLSQNPIITSCEVCSIQGCIICTSLVTCIDCDENISHFLDNSTNQCIKCSINGCLICLSLDVCQTCNKDEGFVENQKFTCDKVFQCSLSINRPIIPRSIYSIEDCQIANNIKILGNLLMYGGYSLFFLTLFTGKIVGLELFGVFQMAHLNLADNQFVHLYLSPLLDWRNIHGFNFIPLLQIASSDQSFSLRLINATYIQSKSQTITSQAVFALGYTQSFVQNINVMFLALFINALASIIFLVLSKKFTLPKLLTDLIGKQILVTIFMFNSLNIGFCLGLHLRYSSEENTELYFFSTFCSISALIISLYVIYGLMFWQDHGFGQFKQKFKKNFITRGYITISLMYRLCLGFHMGYQNQKSYQTSVILGLSIAFIIFNISNLSFCDTYQNYRSNACHIIQFIILMVTNYYTGLKSGEQIRLKSTKMRGAYIEIVALCFCFIISVIYSLYELYLWISKRKTKYRQRKSQANQIINDCDQSKMKGNEVRQQTNQEYIE